MEEMTKTGRGTGGFDATLLRVALYLSEAAYLNDRGLPRQARRLRARAEACARESGYTELLLLVWSHEPAPARAE